MGVAVCGIVRRKRGDEKAGGIFPLGHRAGKVHEQRGQGGVHFRRRESKKEPARIRIQLFLERIRAGDGRADDFCDTAENRPSERRFRASVRGGVLYAHTVCGEGVRIYSQGDRAGQAGKRALSDLGHGGGERESRIYAPVGGAAVYVHIDAFGGRRELLPQDFPVGGSVSVRLSQRRYRRAVRGGSGRSRSLEDARKIAAGFEKPPPEMADFHQSALCDE